MAMILFAFQKFNESNKKSRSFFKFRVPLSIRLLTRMGKLMFDMMIEISQRGVKGKGNLSSIELDG